jgi:hypothetical protein
MRYSPDLTRELYRDIVARRGVIRKDIRSVGGVIGNADFIDIDVRNGCKLFCQKHKLIDNTAVYDECTPAQIEQGHNWDADGVWVPCVESERGTA